MYFSRRILSLRFNIGIIFDILQILKNKFDGLLNIAAIKFNSLKLPTFLELFLKFFILFKSESPGAIVELIPSHLKTILQPNLNRIAGVVLDNNIFEEIIDVFLFIEQMLQFLIIFVFDLTQDTFSKRSFGFMSGNI